MWNAANELMGLVPGIGTLEKAIISFSKIARFSRCQGAGNQAAITLTEFTDAMEPIAENAADQQARHQEEAKVTGLINRLKGEEANINGFADLTQQEQTLLIARIDNIASDADSYEKEATAMQFMVAPTFRMAASLKNFAYNLEYDLLPDGELKNNLLTKKIPDARNDSIVRLLKIESSFESYIMNSGLWRDYSWHDSNGRRHYKIHAKVTLNGLEVYHQDWECVGFPHLPRACSTLVSRRNEFFTKARDKALDIRESLAKVFDASYLNFKNRLGVYSFLRSEAPSGFYIQNDMSNNCMVVDQDGSVSITNSFDLCSFDYIASAPEATAWQVVPETGQIESTSLKGMCLDVPIGQLAAENPSVMVHPCQEPDPETGALPEGSTQAWGFHPLGFIVNMATNKCLTSPTVRYNGALLVAADCNYRYPPPDDWAPTHGAYIPGYGVQHGDSIFSGQYWFVAGSPWWNLPNAPDVESGDVPDNWDGDSWGDDAL